VKVLLTGATGYIGGRLAPVLLEHGHQLICLTRDENRLRDVPWRDQVEVVEGDVRDEVAVRRAFDGVDAAYFLVHSLGTGKAFADRDRAAAEVVARAARAADVQRLVYLGGLVPRDAHLSKHLESRAEVGDILLASGVPTVELRAAVILGSGSASFEMLRYLTERLPAMITPRWVANRVQPIAIRDVVRYLADCLDLPREVSRSFDIGGPDVLTYKEMMVRYAQVAGLAKRVIIPVPVLSPALSSHWVGVVTPVPRSLARPLVESLRNEVVAQDHDIATYLPDPPEGLLPFDMSVRLALQRVRDHDVTTRWSSAAWPDAPSDPLPSDPDWAGGSLYVDERSVPVHATRAELWDVIESIGGENGWYSWPLAWAVRGWLDRSVGGVGLRRGRRDSRRLYVGESLDFWRVEAMDRGRMLRLRAEMKVPGLAWLELSVDDGPDGTVTYHQRAIFHPRGLMGHLYWRAISPFHGAVFGGMLRNIAAKAEPSGDATPKAPAVP
jgi:uncharacterized protein YbjT (DUF2867 family)